MTSENRYPLYLPFSSENSNTLAFRHQIEGEELRGQIEEDELRRQRRDSNRRAFQHRIEGEEFRRQRRQPMHQAMQTEGLNSAMRIHCRQLEAYCYGLRNTGTVDFDELLAMVPSWLASPFFNIFQGEPVLSDIGNRIKIEFRSHMVSRC